MKIFSFLLTGGKLKCFRLSYVAAIFYFRILFIWRVCVIYIFTTWHYQKDNFLLNFSNSLRLFFCFSHRVKRHMIFKSTKTPSTHSHIDNDKIKTKSNLLICFPNISEWILYREYTWRCGQIGLKVVYIPKNVRGKTSERCWLNKSTEIYMISISPHYNSSILYAWFSLFAVRELREGFLLVFFVY